ncbi:hypothetical protein PPSIR1_29478 [Plesiocystis pacifica SIR-1]|uniref:Uncharacterized protein n=1 Tax=Plesiocystis pacifica SIR-1 TaxID=391625 RepID=A6G663_9BACT|nr:hypothetical protein PPSIR1_29478 [Plesiocystis pacifica SIR-1]
MDSASSSAKSGLLPPVDAGGGEAVVQAVARASNTEALSVRSIAPR